MGSPSATEAQNWTDRVAALVQLDLTGYSSELGVGASNSLGVMVDGSADLDLSAYLLAYANAVDDQSLPENWGGGSLSTILNRPAYLDFCNRFVAQVKSAGGGSYASLPAYLTAKSATLHPLVAEVFRRGSVGESGFLVSSDVTTVFSPNYQTRAADQAYVGTDGSLADETTDFEDAGTADVNLFVADDDCVYLGSRYKFTQAIFGLSTKANVTVTPTVQYWNGNAWVTVTPTDNTSGFTRNDTISWALPTDWVRSYKDGGGTAFANLTPLYYIRIQRTANTVGTPPVATCARIVPVYVPLSSGSARHLGVDQPPLGIARITGVNTVVVESIVSIDYTRFREPGVYLRALTPFAVNLTPTVNYTNQAGTAGRSQAQSAWVAPAALATVAVTLQSPDTGVRTAAATGSVTTAATDGVYEIYAPAARTPAL